MKALLAIAAICLSSPLALADEGMWTFNNFPTQKVKQKYGFEATQPWLDHVRLSSLRLAQGCSASLVSPNGLVMTNHHCAHSCIEQLSTAQKDYVASGFFAVNPKDEVKCPVLEANQLIQITDVTERVRAATKGLEGKPYNDALKAEMSKIEKECAASSDVRCDVVSLYHNGIFNLYKYRRFQDVRLVFAPEFAIAFFGGDPDNFMFPRYDLDVSFLRIYEGDQPAKTEHYFKWSRDGAKEGDLSFVTGNPGGTSRQKTVAELEYQRDVAQPANLLRLAELRGYLTAFADRGPEFKRISSPQLFGAENSFKAIFGRQQALLDKAFFASKVAAEQAFRAKVNADPAKKRAYGGAWESLAKVQVELKQIRRPLVYLEQSVSPLVPAGFQSQLFTLAKMLVRTSEELTKPNETRLREYTDSAMPAIKQRLFSPAPIYDDLEIATLTFSLTKLRETLGPDDAVVRKVLGKNSPKELATALVKGSKLKDVALRKALFDGGKKAVDASDDPMIQLARKVDGDARAVRKLYEDDIESVEKKNQELIAKANFEIFGTSHYPDATFTARVSYGQVKGWIENGKPVAPITTMAGAFERNTGREPFALPNSWLGAKSRLNLSTAMNFTTTNDIIGGNSGSPVINKNAEIIGLVFDGNIHSLGGDFGFDEALNRTVAVHSAALLEALGKIYGANRILDELRPQQGAGGK
ncbi:MAG TPA: S46 family peptidase [Myxococcaceae bacterium]|nr:S46 family peptidase [Myxococcaceae bacterium]